MVNIIDAPMVTTTARSLDTGKVDIRSAGACLCAAVCLSGVLSFASAPLESRPIYSNSSIHASTIPTQTLVYDSNGVTVFLTSLGDAMLDLSVRNNLSLLSEIALLEDNWNNNGATGFSESLINRCRESVKNLVHQPDIFPTADTSIQFEWEKTQGEYLEIELFENGLCKMACRDARGEWFEQEIEYVAIGDCVEQFFA